MFSRLAFNAARQVAKFNPTIVPIRAAAVKAEPIVCPPKTQEVEKYEPLDPEGLARFESAERDLVNFPRPVAPEQPGQVRFLFIPEEWFKFFYEKTGVTGPYTFFLGFATYLHSKEIFVIDHEYSYIFASILVVYYGNKKFGKILGEYLDKETDKDNQSLIDMRTNELQGFRDGIANEKKLQFQSEAQRMIVDLKKENVALQQEAIYRERALQAFNEVKKRLEFQSQKQLMERRVSQKHMVGWVVNQVLKSITPQQEQDTLNKCISDLQALSARA